MSQLRRNLLANYVGQAWSAAMGLAFIPVYITHLGMEAYGIIGLFAVLQAWLALLDMGMTPTLSREMARFSAGAHTPQSIADLLRSLELLCLAMASAIGLLVWLLSDDIANHWLRLDRLPTAAVANALSYMAIVIAFRFVEGIYRGALVGLQRQVWLNVTGGVLATLRHGGVVGVLVFVSPTIGAFFLWQALSSALSVALFASKVHGSLPRPPAPAKPSRAAIAGVWKFASGMLGISLLGLVLTQVDKVLLSRLVRLDEFGHYTLAATAAGALYMLSGPINQAVFPRMVELVTREDHPALSDLHHLAAQLVTVLGAPAVLVICMFAEGFLFAWSGDAVVARAAGPTLSVLIVGTFLNTLVVTPYQLQLAHGWTSLAIKTNLVAIAVLLPMLLWIVPRHGALGAAWVWALLNAGYVLISVQFMHRRLLPGEQWRWYLRDILLPCAGVVVVVLFASRIQPNAFESRLRWAAFLGAVGVAALAVAAALADRVRGAVRTFVATRRAA